MIDCTVMARFSGRRVTDWLPWLIGAIAGIFYISTAAPGIVELFDDSLEFQLVAPTLGIAHPTGYPLYTLLGALWSRVLFPFGNWAWRMNLLSALAAGVTVGLVYTIARRLISDNRGQANHWAALAAATAFALGPVWQSQATVAEVYALHTLFVAALLAAALGINRVIGEESHFNRRMLLVCALAGLALAHHRTIVLVLFPLALYLLWSVPGIAQPRRAWIAWAAAALLPLLLYLYLPLRASMGARDLNGSYVNRWDGFWRHVLARDYAAFFAENTLSRGRDWVEWLALLRDQMGIVGLALAALGLVWLVERTGRPAKAWLTLLLVFALHIGFAAFYRVPDAEVFLIPGFLALALFCGAGVGLVGRLPIGGRAAALAQAALILVLVAGWGRGPLVTRSGDWAAHDYATLLASAPFPPGSRVIGLEGEISALLYMQAERGLAPNATGIVADDPAARIAAIEASVAAGAPTFVTRELPGIEGRYSFTGDGVLVRVWPRGAAQTGAPEHPLDYTLEGAPLRIEGYDLARVEHVREPRLRVTLYWRAVEPLARTLKVSLRLLDAQGEAVPGAAGAPLVEDRFPLLQAAPTQTWLPGEVLADGHVIPLPESFADGRLRIIVYDTATVEEVGRLEIPLDFVNQ